MNKNDLLRNLAQENVSLDVHAIIAEEMALDPMAMLRRLYGITIDQVQTGFTPDGMKFIYTIWGHLPDGRKDVGTSAAELTGLAGADWNNAIKAAETQAKRRLTTSLIGYGFAAPEGERNAASEPVAPETPTVNHAPAAVVPDERAPVAVVADQTQPIPKELEAILPKVPDVTEATLAKMHADAQKLDKPASDPTALPKEKPVEAPQASIFDVEDETPAPPAVQPAPAPEVVQPVAAEGQTEPEPVKDLEIAPVASEKPSRLQFQGFTARCTKLCRDVLPKAGKEVAQGLLPYLRKVFNVTDLSQATCLQWESTLARLEGKTPAEAAAIIKSGK